MTKRREINIKPSCMSEIYGFPSAQAAQLWEKIHYLVEDPFPDGKLKKKLKEKKGIYRLRVGDFRVFYTFGDTWVRLLGIRRRDERLYSAGMVDIQADQPRSVAEAVDIDTDVLDVEEAPRPEFQLAVQDEKTPLPRRITAEWLHDLQVPAACIPILVSCESEEAFDYVIVDEAQDLTPTALCLMAELARSQEGLFFASDTKQSLYSRNYTWTGAHPRLQFQGRTRTLTRNYRSTVEIDRAAFDVLIPEQGEAIEPSTSIHSGPMPVLVTSVPLEEESGWAARFVRQMSRHLRMKLDTSAVLVPNRDIGQRVADELSGHGLPAQFFPGRELDLHAEVVKVLTLHSAKGLEFPIVVLCGFEPGTYPEPGDFEDAEVYLERMRHERRLLYVGMSRAMRGLMVIRNAACAHAALHDLKPDHWHVEVAE